MADFTDLSGIPVGAGVAGATLIAALVGAAGGILTMATAGAVGGTHILAMLTTAGALAVGVIHMVDGASAGMHLSMDIMATIFILELHSLETDTTQDTTQVESLILIQDVQIAFTAAGQTPEVLQHDLRVDLM